jgi:Ca2+-binding RTX toxin-like protein
MKIEVVSAAIGVVAVLLGSGTAAAAVCTEVSATELDIQLDPGERAVINVVGGFIRVNGDNCASAAVAWQIDVLGAAGDETAVLNQNSASLGGFDWNAALGDGADTLTVQGSTGPDRFTFGRAGGNDVVDLDGDATPDVIIGADVEGVTGLGGSGNDVIEGQLGGIAGSSTRNLTLFGQDGNDVVRGGSGDDTLSGGDGIDILQGRLGDDVLRGGAGNDTLVGAAGDDLLQGQTGNDVEQGGAGDDIFSQSAAIDGNDRLDGGNGIDIVTYARSNSVTIDLTADEGGEGAENDRLTRIENARGGTGDDLIIGDDGPNVLIGGDGDDTLQGGLGADTLNCGDGDDSFSDPDNAASPTCENELPTL